MSASLAHVLLPSDEVCKEIANQVERDTNEGDCRSFGHSCKCENNTMPFLNCSLLHSSPTDSGKFWHKRGFSSLLQYLELRFNKYLRFCGTALFIIQTASKSQAVCGPCSHQDSSAECNWLFSLGGCWGYHSAWVAGSERNKTLSAPEQWGREQMLGYLPTGSLCALLSTQNSHLASVPCQGMSSPSLQGSRVKSSPLHTCWKNSQLVRNVNMPSYLQWQFSSSGAWILGVWLILKSLWKVRKQSVRSSQLLHKGLYHHHHWKKLCVSANWEVANYCLGEC